jgi:hypothetical protein
MLERLKTSDAIAEMRCKSEIPISNCQAEFENQNYFGQAKMDSGFFNSNLPCENQNSNLVLPSRIDLANEIFDLQDLTERYWRVITAQHVRIARLESELLCVRTAKL